LEDRGWREKMFKTRIRVDDDERDSPTHKVDCFVPVESSRDLQIKKGCGISWINKGQKFGKLITATTFYFSFKSGAATRLRFDLKEKQCLKQMEHGARGHLNKSVR
jgi:hypothetical protein